MSVRLIVEVLDHAPEGLTAVDRLLLVVIAENANDTTREGYPGWELIARRMRWTGHKDGGKAAVRVALANLASRGVDVRVPITQGKDGRPVYAANGHRTVYRIPHFRRGAESAPLEGGQRVPTFFGEGGQSPYGKGGNPHTGRGAESAPPSPQEPSRNPQQRAADLIAEKTGATADDAAAVVELIEQTKQPRSIVPFVRRLADDGELPALLVEIQRGRERKSLNAWVTSLAALPPCEHGYAGGDQSRPDTGEPQCPICRAGRRRATP